MTVSIEHRHGPVSTATETTWHGLDSTLAQLEDWLRAVAPKHYQGVQLAAGVRVPQGQTPGKHVRHILDHVGALCAVAIASQPVPIDYDQRDRDQQLEVDPASALAQLQTHREVMADWVRAAQAGGSASILVRHDTGQYTEDHASSLSRELIYVTEHAIHHMALISLLMAVQGKQLPKDFGVNPSTLRYQAQVSGDRTDERLR